MSKHFLVESDVENGRHRVFKFAIEMLDAHTLRNELDTLFVKLKCAAKLNFAFGCVLKKNKDASCRFYYAKVYLNFYAAIKA